ncbi:MAG: elongation factor P [Candidatus Brocadiaceae bacterium]|uniref:elongation factor P n=1 Tax=Candidatus Wunengus sp. YC61 TaxID=3367698 RepID=UPI0027254500|nr:elongation factor P [Candidatus Brocadiaceae bacterium]
MLSATEIKRGTVLKMDGELYLVVDYQHVTPGNWRGMVQAKLKSMKQGSIVQKRFRSTDKIEDVFLEHRTMEYLYKDGENYCFMDTENYEQLLLPKEAVADAMPYMTLNSQANIAFYEGKALSVELPTSVSLKIVETDPGMKGDTVVNVYKAAKVETGLIVKVPLFITNGEVIKVDTRTGEFLGRE